MYLKPFNRACLSSLAIMTAYSSYDGIPAIANSRKFNVSHPPHPFTWFGVQIFSPISYVCQTCMKCLSLTVAKLRNEWGYKYWVTTDAGSVDLLITTHGTCADRECAARTAVENISGEMGGGTYTYLTLPGELGPRRNMSAVSFRCRSSTCREHQRLVYRRYRQSNAPHQVRFRVV